MRITELKTHLITVGPRNLVLVRIDTDEGIYGIGEGTATHGAGSRAVGAAL